MINVFLVIQIIISIFLILTIILQKDSTDSLRGLSGSGLNNPVSAPRTTETLLAKITKYLGIIFFINCLILSNLATNQGKNNSLINKIDEKITKTEQDSPIGE